MLPPWPWKPNTSGCFILLVVGAGAKTIAWRWLPSTVQVMVVCALAGLDAAIASAAIPKTISKRAFMIVLPCFLVAKKGLFPPTVPGAGDRNYKLPKAT
jgi:hypothetical protein